MGDADQAEADDVRQEAGDSGKPRSMEVVRLRQSFSTGRRERSVSFFRRWKNSVLVICSLGGVYFFKK